MSSRGAQVITGTWGGKTFRAGRRTAAHLEATFAAFAKRFPRGQLRIVQGCYHTGVAASAGTHDKDGVIDFVITGGDWWYAQRLLRELGWAAWYRHTGSWGSPGEWHIHAISLGCPGPLGVYVPGQIDDYYRHAFGLAGEHGSGSDKSWFPPNINATIFRWPPARPVDQQVALNIESGKAPAHVKRPKVAQRMRQIINRLRKGTLK